LIIHGKAQVGVACVDLFFVVFVTYEVVDLEVHYFCLITQATGEFLISPTAC
jgi:hypothetical protein